MSPNATTLDLRAIVRAAMIAAHGPEEGAQAALARRMAPAWGCSDDSAVKRLSRWFNRVEGLPGDMTTDAFALLLDGLYLAVVPRNGRPRAALEQIDRAT